MWYTNDGRYLPGNATVKAERLDKPGEDNVPFPQGRSPSLRKAFSSYRNLSVKGLRNIALGD